LGVVEKGEYGLRATQEVVVDNDFILIWELMQMEVLICEGIKKDGYVLAGK
jgi:hypothetical protein